ncbi:hypothetical protein SDC9_203019 [bioreactor metagenome]|uniref:Uncharacterized protein n=1 Tax=bioreactor metagenome TaxID=1076179 RepID=A0A645IW23_9ZZZZ
MITSASLSFQDFYITKLPTLKMIKATIHATAVWKHTVSIAWCQPPISLLIVANVATQGIYKRQNAKNAKADNGVKICVSIVVKEAPSDAPVKTAMVLTTASFADKPVISAVAALQSPKPRGSNTGETAMPKEARMLSSLLETRLSP